jgi:hypothetical protein
MNDRYARWKEKQARGAIRRRKPLKHGTPYGYTGWGCKCEACLAARAAAKRRRSRGEPAA